MLVSREIGELEEGLRDQKRNTKNVPSVSQPSIGRERGCSDS